MFNRVTATPGCEHRVPVLTVKSQDGWREGRGVGESELDGVLFGPLQQLRGILALLLLRALLLALLLLPGQRLLRLLLLRGDTRQNRRVNHCGQLRMAKCDAISYNSRVLCCTFAKVVKLIV